MKRILCVLILVLGFFIVIQAQRSSSYLAAYDTAMAACANNGAILPDAYKRLAVASCKQGFGMGVNFQLRWGLNK